MKKLYILSLFNVALSLVCFAQVKSNYLYSTSMPYGTLDIRTKISSTDYFYLQENKTFSFRESAPGVRTNTWLDMTTWDSSPYGQGNLRRKTGTKDLFVMNYRLLQPMNYNATFANGYPLLVLFHGGAERANCYFNNCYHGTWDYDPNVNNPAAPTTSTHKLLNNDDNLDQGGKTFMDARNKAAGKLPNDPALNSRAFPGFVLVPQMMNVWDSLNVQDAVRMVQLIAEKYNIDENRIYIFGLSIGGYATYEAIKRASWLFAAAMPTSGVKQASIVRYNQQGKVAHLPLWIFQGGKDTNPSPAYTNKFVTDMKNAGATPKLTVYADLAHTCWNKAFTEPEFYTWLLSKDKANIHAYKGITAINATTAQYPKLVLAEGFFVYQWEKDGKVISGATANTYVAKSPGVYRARFSRVSAPTATQWNKWSAPVTITTTTAAARMQVEDSLQVIDDVANENTFQVHAFPNPATADELTITVRTIENDTPVGLQLLDPVGKSIYREEHTPVQLAEGVKIPLSSTLANGIYFVIASQGVRSVKQKVIIKK